MKKTHMPFPMGWIIKKEMEKAARDLDFMQAAKLRDEMFRTQKDLEEMKK
jgi:excinuclease ABC subunit B